MGRTTLLRPAVVTDDSKVAQTITYTETRVKNGRVKSKTQTKVVGSS